MKQRRILQLCHDYRGPFRSLCQQYARAFDDMHVTTVFLCGEADDEIASAVGGDEVIFLDRPRREMKGLKISTLLMLHRFLKSHPCDLVIAQRYRPVYFSAILSMLHPIAAVIAVVHEHGVYRARARKRIVWYGKNVSLVGVSDSVSRDLEHAFPTLADQGRLFTLPNTIDPEDELLDRAEARAALGLPADGLVFGSIGRLIDKKEHHVLIDGFARYVERGGDGELMIIGAGPLEATLRAQIRDLGLTQRVHLAGEVPRASRYLRAFDAFVLSSGELEAFGVVLLEAMVARLPVICSRAPGPMEVVGDVALTFDTGDVEALAGQLEAMRSLSGDERTAMGRQGHDRFMAMYAPDVFRERLRALPPVRRALRGV